MKKVIIKSRHKVSENQDITNTPKVRTRKIKYGQYNLKSGVKRFSIRPEQHKEIHEITEKLTNKNSETSQKPAEQGSVQLPQDKNNILQTCLSSLQDQYGVHPEILETDAEFYSETIFRRTVTEKVYFLSKENPEETFKVTESLIRQSDIRYELMHASRVEKSTHNAINHRNFIETIRSEYEQSNNGKSPSNNKIAQILNERKIEAPRGKNFKWHSGSVERVLQRTKDEGHNDDGQTR